ncbi:ran-specific GTPase-activating protein 1, putative [Plasmodium vinckei vinckei]|uniref:Ran-specific GTPase-activating protein 1, putative n=1 Tax=Plasmodium vinckei vinckei TaxID=54757 RepID=A0A449BR17_PLAVN|nr:ran-specific GTPase-activating protein 1, putative [Plasmodium vinckei vinckei]VEV55838.1 ran-specific GTPase-activating protein 1, putative [Plasmodium vinckei vinckei]
MEDEKNDYNPEEEVTTGNWNTPKIELKEVEIKTGEEDESLFWSGRSKLYRWVEGEWKERGLGESKLLLHKKNGTIRFLLRQEKTLKVVANHYIYPNESYCKLVPNAGSEKIYAWTVKDFAEEPKIEQFALKFNTAEAAKLFKQKFDEAGQINLKLLDDKCELKTEKAEDKEKKDEKKGEEKDEKDKKDEKEDKDKKEEKEDKDKKEEKDKKDDKDKKDEKEDKDKKEEKEDKDKKEEKEDKDKKDDKEDKDKKDDKEDKDKKDDKEDKDKKDDKDKKEDKDKKDEEENIKRED